MLVTALIITIAIFLIGFYLGYLLDNLRIDDASQLLKKSELDSESFEISERFFYLFTKGECSFDRLRLNELGKQLADMGRTLTVYDNKKLTRRQSYNDLKRKYFISELKFYNMNKELDDKCGKKNSIILFFYNVEGNEESLRQGYVLDILGKEYNDLSILSFDKDFDDYSIKSLTSFYGVEKAPTIIINYENKYQGFVSEGELRAVLNENKTN